MARQEANITLRGDDDPRIYIFSINVPTGESGTVELSVKFHSPEKTFGAMNRLEKYYLWKQLWKCFFEQGHSMGLDLDCFIEDIDRLKDMYSFYGSENDDDPDRIKWIDTGLSFFNPVAILE